MSEEQGISIASDDFIEQLIKHIARDQSVFAKAKQFDLSGNDFVLDDIFGSQIYKAFTDCIMDNGPMNIQLLATHLNTKFNTHELPASQYDDSLKLLAFIYDDVELSPDYVKKNLSEFLKIRRTKKAMFECKENPTSLIGNLAAINVKLDMEDVLAKAIDIHPFEQPVFKRKQEMIGTGLNAVDEHIQGLGLGEFAIVIGYSGGGKTVLGTNIVSNNAALGIPSTFVSCEEDETQISQRFYSKFFEIPYTELHRGQANIQLENMFKDESLASLRQTLAKNLHMLGLKGLTPVTTDQIYELMVRKYEKTAFVPQVVVVDQLQFIEAMNVRKSMSSWELEKQAAAELDELSHKSIGGHKFAVWVLHQAKGKLKRHFTRDEIDGFKGIIHKADLVMGIGRDGVNANEVDIFSLKVRHCADFSVTLGAEFRLMRFVDRSNRSLAMAGYSRTDSNPSASLTPPPLPDGPPAPPEMPAEPPPID